MNSKVVSEPKSFIHFIAINFIQDTTPFVFNSQFSQNAPGAQNFIANANFCKRPNRICGQNKSRTERLYFVRLLINPRIYSLALKRYGQRKTTDASAADNYFHQKTGSWKSIRTTNYMVLKLLFVSLFFLVCATVSLPELIR